MIAQAKALDIEYGQILAAPWRFLGKPVLWDIKIPSDSTRYSYVNEDIRMPIRWVEQPDIQGQEFSASRVVLILAKVHDLGPPGCYNPKAGERQACYVQLEFISER
jgi:hypothetical protein